MTEEEAKKKWCPFARQMVSIDQLENPVAIASANRFHKDKIAGCLASRCMAWRWRDDVTTDGYCGLAGKP